MEGERQAASASDDGVEVGNERQRQQQLLRLACAHYQLAEALYCSGRVSDALRHFGFASQVGGVPVSVLCCESLG